MPESSEPIVIELEAEQQAPTQPREFKDLLQQDELRKVLDHLLQTDRLKEKSQPSRSSSRPRHVQIAEWHQHDTLFIHGERGVGKTTFIATLLHSMEDPERFQNLIDKAEISDKRDSDDLPKLYSLGLLDPTRLEEKQNFLILLVNRIRAVFEHVRRNQRADCDDECGTSPEECDKKLRRLARGLAHLPGVGKDKIHDENWNDPDFVLDEGLDDADAGDLFTHNLEDYIECVLRHMGYDAFVLAVDDIDTAFDRGAHVLENLRKYLATPRLRIILTGDLALYRLLVQRQQYRTMGQDLLDIERKKAEASEGNMSTLPQIHEAVQRLEEQYLTKILPPANRYRLRTLYDLIYVDGRRVRLKRKVPSGREDRQEVSARVLLRHFARFVFAIRHTATRDTFIAGITQQPVRSSLQILAPAASLLRGRGFKTADDRRAVSTALHQTAYTAIANTGIAPDRLALDVPSRMLVNFAAWFTDAGDWHNLPRLYPEFERPEWNLAACAGAGLLTESFRTHPAGMLEYLVKIAAVRAIHDAGRISTNEMRSFVRHTNLRNLEAAYNTAGRIAGWLRTPRHGTGLQHQITPYALPVLVEETSVLDDVLITLLGIRPEPSIYDRTAPTNNWPQLNVQEIGNAGDEGRGFYRGRLNDFPDPLFHFHKRLIENQAPYDFHPAPDDERRHAPGPRIKGRLYNSVRSLSAALRGSPGGDVLWPAFVKNLSGENVEYGTFSILRMLGVIERLLRIPDFGAKRDEAEAFDELREAVAAVPGDVTTLRTYPSAHAALAETGTPGAGEDDVKLGATGAADAGDVLGSTVAQPPDNLIDAFAAWLNGIERSYGDAAELVAAPLTLARIWTRFHYTATNIRESLKHLETMYLGVLIHRYIVAFLHALAVEQARGNGDPIGDRMSMNPNTSSAPFKQVLDTFYPERNAENHQPPALFQAVFTCPLWGFFLAKEAGWETRDQGAEEKKMYSAVFSHYKRELRNMLNTSSQEWTDDDIDELFRCEYIVEGTGQNPIFDNLFVPLNTLPIMGQQARRRPEEGLRTDVLGEAWTGPQRDA